MKNPERTVETYLVIARNPRDRWSARITRHAARRPSLKAGEIMFKVKLKVPDKAFDAPLFTVAADVPLDAIVEPDVTLLVESGVEQPGDEE